MITRKSLADEIDLYDQQIADLNSGKKDCFDAYRDQMIAAGVAKPNIKTEIDAVKVAIKRRREAAKDRDGMIEKDALIDEVFDEITRAPRATREIIEKFATDGTKYDAASGEILEDNQPGTALQSPRKAAEAVSERTAFQVDIGKTISAEATIEGQPSVTVATSAESAGEAVSADLPTISKTDAAISRPVIASLGRPEIENRSDKEAPEAGASGGMQDEIAIHPATPIAPAAQGEAEAPSVERVNPEMTGSAAANVGGDHVTDKNAATSNNRLDGVPVQSVRPRLRPHCQHRELCRSGTVDHCHSCKTAMKEEQAA